MLRLFCTGNLRIHISCCLLTFIVKVTNPGTLMTIHTDLNNNFLYAFFALGQCIKGFQTVIRPFIVIDATHLKGAFEGVIYVASCKDGDEHAYHIAFGVGNGEIENSWTWFLERLREAIGEVGGMIFVSDSHANIAKALSIVYPNVPHSYCSTSKQFNLEMDEIKKIHQGTYDTLMSIGHERWSRSQCPGRRREQAGKNPTYLGNATVGHCKERNEWSLTYNVYPIELTRYLVKDGKHDGLVDIEHHMCTCHNWDLDQLPCDHAIAVARFTKTNFNSICHEYYNISWM
ncbi:hypothetical protein Ddye_020498 [Dipteronia dyeriana]|uniref:SWIM-type domain-containing protein n=1 Tax=Dipteronia dyeriana TaxID=168575 RepID=A0AAD9WWM6_9ROSI|nr:hypothetical protein Ddye_020498 [Dipteronia dyeriana]